MPAQFDVDGVRGYLEELHERGNSQSSAARRLAALRTFARYLVREEITRGGSDRAGRRASTRPDAAGAPGRGGNSATAGRAGSVDAGRPPRSRHSRTVLRVGPSPERTGRPRSGGCEPVEPHGARARQGRQGTPRAVQPAISGSDSRDDGGPDDAAAGAAAQRDRGVRRRHARQREPLFLNLRGAG